MKTVLFWWCPDWYPAAVSAAAALSSISRTASRATDTSSTVAGPLQQLVLAFVYAWLLLTQRVLLQQPDGLVHRAAATEQHLPVGSELAKQVRGSAHCGCLRHVADTPAQKASVSREVQCHSCVTLSCEAQYALGSLLAALQRMAVTSSNLAFELEVPEYDWRDHANSVALVLEVVARKLLPHYALCSGNSSSNSGSIITSGPGNGLCGTSSSSALSESRSNTSDITPGLHAANAAPYLRFAFSRCMSELLSGHGLVILLYTQCNDRQLFSLLASAFKLWRCQPETQQQLSVLNSAGVVSSAMAKVSAKLLSRQRDADLANAPGISQVRECLSPWLLLAALFFSTAGQWLMMQMRADAPVSLTACHLQRSFNDIVDTLRLLRVAQEALQCAHKQWWETALEAVQKQQDSCCVMNAAKQAEQLPAMSGPQQQPDTQQQKQEQPQLQPQQQGQQEETQQLQPQEPAEPPAPAAVADVAGPGYQYLEQLLSVITDKDLKGCQDVLSAAAAHAATLAGPTADSMASSGRFGSSSTSSGLCSWACNDATMSEEATSDRAEEVLAAINSIKAAQTLEQCWQATTGVKLLQRLARSLRLEGARLSNNLPAAWLCNNVRLCTDMAGAREQQLIGGSSCVCGGCKVARYCSPSCQAQHWPYHKHACKHLAAAAATAAAAAGSSGNNHSTSSSSHTTTASSSSSTAAGVAAARAR